MKVIKFLFVGLFFWSCSGETKVENESILNNDLQPMGWLEGTWNDGSTFGFKDPPQHIMETWKAYPDSLSGYGFRVQGSDTTITEWITIMVVNDKLTYVARPKGQAMVSFTLIESDDLHWSNELLPWRDLVFLSLLEDNKFYSLDFWQRVPHQVYHCTYQNLFLSQEIDHK